MVKNKIVEICCGSIEDCKIAEQFPVDRIELNSALELGGLTPSIGTLIEAKKVTRLPICCMVRPRTAGFHYSEQQFESMLQDAELLLKYGADGIVFGFLNNDMKVDEERTKKMTALIHSYGKEAVFHKAFDAVADMDEACKTLIACKVDRILTSGGENYPHIEQGFSTLRHLIETYHDQITILVGGGVRAFNVHEICEQTGCFQIHMTAKETAEDNGSFVQVSAANLQDILSHF